jgi:hypothetical protein
MPDEFYQIVRGDRVRVNRRNGPREVTFGTYTRYRDTWNSHSALRSWMAGRLPWVVARAVFQTRQ